MPIQYQVLKNRKMNFLSRVLPSFACPSWSKRPGHAGVHLRIPVKWECCVLGPQFLATGQLGKTAACVAHPRTPHSHSPPSSATLCSMKPFFFKTSFLTCWQADPSAVWGTGHEIDHTASFRLRPLPCPAMCSGVKGMLTASGPGTG